MFSAIVSKERSSADGVLEPRLQWRILPVPVPEFVASVSWMGVSEDLVDALTGDELLKGRFIDPFVDVDATLEALQIASGFSILALCVGRRFLGLLMQQVFDHLGPGGLLGREAPWEPWKDAWQASSMRICGHSSCRRVSKRVLGEALGAYGYRTPCIGIHFCVAAICRCGSTHGLVHRLTNSLLKSLVCLPWCLGCFLVDVMLRPDHQRFCSGVGRHAYRSGSDLHPRWPAILSV